MKIFVYDEGYLTIENSGDSKERKNYLPLDIISACNPQFAAFELVFPKDCEAIYVERGKIIIRRENPDFNKYNPEQKDAYRHKNEKIIKENF